MRTTLKTTTALLACLNLAVPVPALAQSSAASVASVCASEPTSDACRAARQERKAAQQQEKAGQQQQKQQEKAARQQQKAAQQEEKAARQQEQARRQAEKAARQEEKAARQQEKAARQEEKAARQEEKSKAGAEVDTAARRTEGGGNGQGAGKGQGNGQAAARQGSAHPAADSQGDSAGTSAARSMTGGGAGSGEGAGQRARQQAEESDGQGARQQAGGAGAGQKSRQQGGDGGGRNEGNRNAERDRAGTQGGGTAAQRAARSDEPGVAGQAEGGNRSGKNTQGGGGNQAGGGNQGGGGQRAQALAAGRGGGDAKPQEVTTETVTEESARSSAEDFASGIDRSPEASDDGDDGGLSKLEKALLLGAGALAVGSLMRGGREVVASADDRVVVSGSDGGYQIIKDDDALLRQPGSEVQTQTFDDGSTRTIVNRPDGSQIVTIRDPELRVVRRVRVLPDGREILLIDDSATAQPVDVTRLDRREAPVQTFSQAMDAAALRQALSEEQAFDRSYSLNQVRSIEQVRAQVPAIDLETITFASGSAAITPEQADQLTGLGRYISDAIAENPREIFLVEGHTDAVGDAAYNLALSDRRAESVALALTEYFDVPPENLVVQGYGEQFLKVASEEAEQANRRATLRRITPLLQVAASQ